MLQEQYIQRYTYKDYLLWEDKWELINGYPYSMSPAPFNQHQIAGSNFVTLFNSELMKNRATCNCRVMYESDWIINDDTIVKPDVLIACGNIEARGFIRIPPVLIVEIFSDSTRLKDRNTKYKLYEQQGVRYYLMADPDKKTIEYFQLVNNQYQEQKSIEIFELDKACALNINLSTVFD